MNILLSIFFIFTSFTLPAKASTDCHQHESGMICKYKGSTGLELLQDVKIHKIQRVSVDLIKSIGSIVLVKEAVLKDLDDTRYSECWSTSHKLDRDLVMYCTQIQSSPGFIPKIILENILNIKIDNMIFSPKLTESF